MALELKDKKKLGPKRLINSFKYAIEGFVCAFKQEQNMMIHISVAILVVLAGLLLKISLLEWLIIIILIGLVIGTELINTSLEAVVDLTCRDKNALAKIGKDTAAAAVLVFAITSLVAGLIIFLPKILELF